MCRTRLTVYRGLAIVDSSRRESGVQWEQVTIMFGLCSFWKRGAPAAPARGEKARPGEDYGDALLAGWVTPPEDSVPAPQAAPAQKEQPDEAVLERFYRNQG
jgi:hypothetical protein